MHQGIVDAADVGKRFPHMAAFGFQLLFIAEKLPFAAAANPAVGTGGAQAVWRRTQNGQNAGFRIIFLFFHDADEDPVPGNRLVHKHREPLDFGDALAAERQIRDR